MDKNTHVQSLKADIDVVVTGTPLQFTKLLNNIFIKDLHKIQSTSYIFLHKITYILNNKLFYSFDFFLHIMKVVVFCFVLIFVVQ